MDPLIQAYATTVHGTLEYLPNELQELVSHMREYDVQIVTLLREIEMNGLSGEKATNLNEAYKLKSNIVTQILDLLREKVSNLNTAHSQAITVPESVDNNVHVVEEEVVNKSIPKRNRKQPANKIVRSPKLRQVSPPTTPENILIPPKESLPTGDICICKGFLSGDTIKCDNPRCKTGTYHMHCVGVTSKPKHMWICNFCIQKI